VTYGNNRHSFHDSQHAKASHRQGDRNVGHGRDGGRSANARADGGSGRDGGRWAGAQRHGSDSGARAAAAPRTHARSFGGERGAIMVGASGATSGTTAVAGGKGGDAGGRGGKHGHRR
jgi:hypothetical protein